MSNLSRRQLLIFLGAAGGSAAFAPAFARADQSKLFAQQIASLGFTPVRLPHELPIYTSLNSYLPAAGYVAGNHDGTILPIPRDAKRTAYTVVDDVVVPPEYERYVILTWGARVFPARPGGRLNQDYVGYNCDYTAFVPTNPNLTSGYLWVNHEYTSFPFDGTSPETPVDTASTPSSYPLVIGRDLPASERFGEFMYNMGGSIVRIAQNATGRYQVVLSDPKNRRIHGLSGLGLNATRTDGFAGITSWGTLSYQIGDQNYLEGTGPAATEVFPLSTDGLGNKIIGTGYNCSGAYTPWGTVLSAEENFQGSSSFFVGVQESMLPNGTQNGYVTGTTGAFFGLVGEKYGWMVEIDPADPNFRPKKHSWLGRFRHENAAIRAQPNQRLALYMGDDRRGGHTWKFVSKNLVTDPKSKSNSNLLADGTLYVAKFNADGTGQWLPVLLNTPVDPISPLAISADERAQRVDGLASRDANTRFPRRAGVAGQTSDGGSFTMTTLNELTVVADGTTTIDSYRTLGNTKAAGTVTLADYFDTQGAILCDVFLAANLIGGTPTARPEDFEINPRNDREIFIAYTDGAPGSDGYPDSQVFTVSKYSTNVTDTQPSGGLYKIVEDTLATGSLTFRWERFQQGGETGSEDGSGFANVDNLAFDALGSVWGVTDMSTDLHNGFVSGAGGALQTIDHASTSAANLVGVFGNNWLFFVPTSGLYAGEVIPFAQGPVRAELTGPTFIGGTLILAVQHPGENCPINDGTSASTLNRNIEMLSEAGSLYTQNRTVPRGSNWPSNLPIADGGADQPDGPPRPSVIGIRRIL